MVAVKPAGVAANGEEVQAGVVRHEEDFIFERDALGDFFVDDAVSRMSGGEGGGGLF